MVCLDSDPINTGLVIRSERLAEAASPSVGFRFGDKGTHTSRTLMLGELTTLLQVSGPMASRAEYRTQILQENCSDKTHRLDP